MHVCVFVFPCVCVCVCVFVSRGACVFVSRGGVCVRVPCGCSAPDVTSACEGVCVSLRRCCLLPCVCAHGTTSSCPFRHALREVLCLQTHSLSVCSCGVCVLYTTTCCVYGTIARVLSVVCVLRIRDAYVLAVVCVELCVPVTCFVRS